MGIPKRALEPLNGGVWSDDHGYRRLAADVILRALKDHVLLSDPDKATDPELLRGARKSAPPVLWLCQDSIYHQMIDLDPRKIPKLLDGGALHKTLSEAMRTRKRN